jgi:hypothetical protein
LSSRAERLNDERHPFLSFGPRDEARPMNTAVQCTQCGAVLRVGALFCTKCGCRVDHQSCGATSSPRHAPGEMPGFARPGKGWRIASLVLAILVTVFLGLGLVTAWSINLQHPQQVDWGRCWTMTAILLSLIGLSWVPFMFVRRIGRNTSA